MMHRVSRPSLCKRDSQQPRLRGGFGLLVLVLGTSCGVSSSVGSLEPFSVEGGQFVEGALPQADEDADDLPIVTSPAVSSAALRERLRGVNFSGTVSDTAQSIGVQFEGLGSGYWLIPTGGRDAQNPNAFLYSFTADLQAALPAGPQTLLAVGFDGQGRPGPATELSLCIRSLRPDNGNACVPTIAPPALVVSLEWDSPVDLDIAIVAPDDQVLSHKQPSLPAPDPLAPPLGRLVLDGNVDCNYDARQREDVVFDNFPPAGKYQIYVSLARTCGESAVTYEASYASRASEGGGNYGVRTKSLGSGTLTAAQVNLSASLGTFVAEVQVQ
jgi:hypothetical protein